MHVLIVTSSSQWAQLQSSVLLVQLDNGLWQNHTYWTPISAHFWATDTFLGGAGSGGGGGAGQMFLDFLKSRLHGLSNDDTTIFTEHPFFVILGPRINFWAGQEQKEAGQLFLSFRNLLSMASPKVCDKTIFNEHSVLVMLRSRTNFWARQKGRVKLVLVLKHSLIGGKLLYPVWRHKLE